MADIIHELQTSIEQSGNVEIPVWIPDSIQEKIKSSRSEIQPQLTARIEKVLDNGLGHITQEFNMPTWNRFAKLKTERERSALLKVLEIDEADLSKFISSPKDEPDVNSLKRKLILKLWNKTSKIWEEDRLKREREMKVFDKRRESGLVGRRRPRGIENIMRPAGRFVEEITGMKNLNDFSERLMTIQPGVEVAFRELK